MASSTALDENYIYPYSPSSYQEIKKTLSFLSDMPSRAIGLLQSTRLKEEYNVVQGGQVWHLKESDKLIIMFRCTNVCVVYRKQDGTVAVIKDAKYTQTNPPVMLDARMFGAFMEGIRMTLMYAVVLENRKFGKSHVHKNELILILAELTGKQFVGITSRMKIGVFPISIVKVITNPRLFLTGGMKMTLKMSEADISHSYEPLRGEQVEIEVFKAHKGLFKWLNTRNETLSMHSYVESDESSLYYNVNPITSSAPFLPKENDHQSFPPPARQYTAENLTQYSMPLDSSQSPGPTRRTLPLPPTLDTVQSPPLTSYLTLQDNRSELDDYEEPISKRTPQPTQHSVLVPPLLPPPKPQEDGSENEKYLTEEDWFHGAISREEAETILEEGGDFLFRLRTDESRTVVFSYCTKKGSYLHSCLELPLNQTRENTVTDAGIRHRIMKFMSTEHLTDNELIKFKRTPIKMPRENSLYKKVKSTKNASLYEDVCYDTYHPVVHSSADSKDIADDSEQYEQVYDGEDQTPKIDIADDSEQYEQVDDGAGQSQINETNTRTAAITRLIRDGDNIVDDAMCETVADYLEEEKWDFLGKVLGVPRNIRRRIDKAKDDICDKTSALLREWYNRKCSEATISVLVDALILVDPEELVPLLLELCDILDIDEAYANV